MIGIRTLLGAAGAAFGLTLGQAAFAATLTLDVPACDSFSLSNNTITCNAQGPGGPVATCSLSGTTSVPLSVGTTTLTDTCSNFAPTSYTWTGCTSTNGNKCTVTSGQAGSVSVAVTATDGTNNVQKSTTVTFNDDTSPPPVGIPTTCDDGTKTVFAGNITSFDGQPVGTDKFTKGQTAYFIVKVPNLGGSIYTQLGWLSIGGFSDQVWRSVYVSKTGVCDTSSPASTGYAFNGSIYGYVGDGSSSISGRAKTGNFVYHMQPGDTWYVMFKNVDGSGRNTCSTSTCPIYIKPAVLH